MIGSSGNNNSREIKTMFLLIMRFQLLYLSSLRFTQVRSHVKHVEIEHYNSVKIY